MILYMIMYDLYISILLYDHVSQSVRPGVNFSPLGAVRVGVVSVGRPLSPTLPHTIGVEEL